MPMKPCLFVYILARLVRQMGVERYLNKCRSNLERILAFQTHSVASYSKRSFRPSLSISLYALFWHKGVKGSTYGT